jgi:shikimate kinase
MSKRPNIIGLAGTNGAGKDSVGAILSEQYGYWFFSLTELFREECRRRGIDVTRAHTRMISIEWRRQSGPATLIDRSLEAYNLAGGDTKYKGCVFSSLRNPFEADRIHELGGVVVWIDAEPRVRYDRIQTNAANRGRAGEDNKTFEQFLQEEQDEMHPPVAADHAVLNTAAVKERADVFIMNEADYQTLRVTTAKALGL